LTPVLCDGVKKDPRPSRGDNVDERGCWLLDDVDGRVDEEDEGEGEFMMSEYMSFSRSKSDVSAMCTENQRTCLLGKRYQRSPA
jgi:hypothetical protein